MEDWNRLEELRRNLLENISIHNDINNRSEPVNTKRVVSNITIYHSSTGALSTSDDLIRQGTVINLQQNLYQHL